jgi:ABC-type Na+ transport system ATPase subunit NatA
MAFDLLNFQGIYPPSDGKIQIFGYDVGTQMNKIRSSIGFCPQISILYDDLTVYEHLYLISAVLAFLFTHMFFALLFILFEDKRL